LDLTPLAVDLGHGSPSVTLFETEKARRYVSPPSKSGLGPA
jgi:hypothetical protein